jgi:hypothetical protein
VRGQLGFDHHTGWYWQRILSRGASRYLVSASLAMLLALEARGQTTGYFGPAQPVQIQPEVDVYYHVNSDFRLLAQVQSTFIPDDSYSGLRVGAFADWMIANVFRPMLSPDLAKTRALNLRIGLQYSTTLEPGTLKSSQTIILQEDITPRYFLPWGILIASRNRFQEQWSLGASGTFSFRYLGRLQFEREFNIGRIPLTPFVNVQLSWTSPPAMWTQFRMEGGLQCGFDWFGRGQIIEANFSVVTKLQPSHSWTPVVGVIWYIYF